MKKSFLIILTMWLSAMAFAGPIDLDQAKQNVLSFITAKKPASARGNNIGAEVSIKVASQAEGYYVFNLGEHEGFVIASSDDRTPAVLGYADNGSFDSKNMPENMKAWLQSYSDQMNATPTSTPNSPIELGRSIAPMIEALWGQDAPYNDKCPSFLGSNCVTGCVATAMAQVIGYYRYPSQTIQKIPAYNTQSANIQVDAIPMTAIDWNQIISNYSYNTTATQNDAIATLMQLCGSSLQMDYTPNSSGAYSVSVAQALKHYFGYSSTARNVRRSDYTAEEWDRLIYTELLGGRPVIYGGKSSAGGHEFVIDGYDGNGYFHVNWGWRGDNNGYFLLSALNPYDNNGIGASGSADGYNMNQDANIGIKPKGESETVIMADLLTISTFSPSLTNLTRIKTDMDFNVILQYSIYNYCAPGPFDFGALVYSTDYKQLEAGTMFDANYKKGSGYTGQYVAFIGKSLPNGQYYLVAGCRATGSSEWYPCENAWQKGIAITINGNSITLSPKELEDPNLQESTSEPDEPDQPVEPEKPIIMLSGQLDVSGQLYEGGKVNLAAIITNYGSDYNDQLYVMLDGKPAGSAKLELAAGKTTNWAMALNDIKAGEHKVVLTADSEGTNIVAEAEFAVSLYPEASLEMKVNATNVVNGLTEENKLSLQLDIINTGTETYDNDVQIQLFCLTDPGNPLYTKQQKCLVTKDGSTSLEFTCEDLDLDQSYYIKAFYLSGNDWIRATQSENYHVRKPEAAVQITMFTIEDILINGTLEVGEDIGLQLLVRNDGNMSSGKLYVWLNEQNPTEHEINVKPGTMTICKQSFTPDVAGIWHVKISRDAEGGDVAAEQDIIIGNNTLNNLAIDLDVPDLDLDGGVFYLDDSSVTLKLTIENTGSKTYDDMIMVSLFQSLSDINNEWGDCIASDTLTCLLDPHSLGSGEAKFGNLIDGEEYFFIVYYRSRNEWVKATSSEAFTVYLEDEMKGHNFTLTDLTFSGKMQVGSPVTAHLTLFNKGTDRTGTIYYQTTGKDNKIKHIDLDIEPNTSATYDVSFYPENAGENWFYIASSKYYEEEWTEDDWYYKDHVFIAKEPNPQLEVTFDIYNLVDNELKDETVYFNMTVSNKSDNPFNREGVIAICKEDNTNIYDYGVISQTDILCQLDSLGSQTWESGGKDILEDGNSYYLAFFYKWHGEWHMEARSPSFKVNKYKPVTKFDVEQIAFNGSLLTLEPVSTEITITNNGNVTNGILYIFVDNTLTNLIRINALATGQTAKYTIKLTPQTAGINTVVIALDAEGKEVVATSQFTISENGIENAIVTQKAEPSLSDDCYDLQGHKVGTWSDVHKRKGIHIVGGRKVYHR